MKNIKWLFIGLLGFGCSAPPVGGSGGTGGAPPLPDGGECIATEGQHCGGFIANPCQCAPGLQCVLSNIPDVGGTCRRAPDAGCVQNVLCIQGSVWDSKLCRCVPQKDGGGSACTADSDCSGILPHICMQCPPSTDGTVTTACAHWKCVDGQCVTRICN